MNAVQETPDLRENLTVLRAESLKAFALPIGALSYSWLIWSLWPQSGGETLPIEAFVGSGLMVLGTSLSYALRERLPRMASILFIGGILIAIFCGLAFQ